MDRTVFNETRSRMWMSGLITSLLYLILLLFFDRFVLEAAKADPAVLVMFSVSSVVMGALAYLFIARLAQPIWVRALAAGVATGLMKALSTFVSLGTIGDVVVSRGTIIQYAVTTIGAAAVAGIVGLILFEGISPPEGHRPSSLTARRTMFLILITGLLYAALLRVMDDSFTIALLGGPQLAAIVCAVIGIDAGISFLVSSFLWRRTRHSFQGNLVRVTMMPLSGLLFLGELNLLWFSLGQGQVWNPAIALPGMIVTIIASWIVYSLVTGPKPTPVRR